MAFEYLRISVTSRCNLGCFYCRADDGSYEESGWEPSPEEIAFLARCAAAEGVTKIRLTGGEPLLRGDLEKIVRLVNAVSGIAETALTTNAIGLARRAAALKSAGLSRVNISLDTLRPERFEAISGSDLLGEVIAGIDASIGAFDPVKLNAVILRGVNDDEIKDLVEFAADRGLHLRFIERYPSPGSNEDPAGPLLAGEIFRRLEEAFGKPKPLGSRPLSVEESFELPTGVTVGIIAGRSHPPCAACAKLRFTSSGALQPCLFSNAEADIREPLQSRDENAVREALRRALILKGSTRRALPCTPLPVNLIGG